MNWTSAPGGKRYHSGPFTLVRQNTAAGAKRWRAVMTSGETCYRVIDTDYLSDAKRACEAYRR
jgi:hypothetical protein